MSNTRITYKPYLTTKTRYTKNEIIALVQSRIIETETGCHEWQGPKTKDGYGQFGEYWIVQQYGIKLVHRMMVHVTTGHEFAGRHEQVMHSCHNRSCCNPDHLSIGTAKENMRQAWERGAFEGKSFGQRGEKHYGAKLTEAQVREIRARRAAGERGVRLAAEYGVSDTTIYDICSRRNWKNVN